MHLFNLAVQFIVLAVFRYVSGLCETIGGLFCYLMCLHLTYYAGLFDVA